MLTAMIFASNGEPFWRIQRRCINSGEVNLFRSPDYRPMVADMVQLINSYHPELAIIEFPDREDALQVESTIRSSCPNVAILGFSDAWETERVMKATGGYLRVIPSAIAPQDFTLYVGEAMDTVSKARPDNVIVFLPARPAAAPIPSPSTFVAHWRNPAECT